MSTAELDSPLAIVTGAGGWLGSRLVQALACGLPGCPPLREPRVRCLVLPGQDAAPLRALSPAVEVVVGDLRERGSCAALLADARDAVVFHTAGIIHPRRVRELYEVNVEGTKNVLELSAEAGVRHAVVVSSNSPCGCNPHADHRFDETSPYHPYMHYGRSKMRMEQAVEEFRSRTEVRTTIIRAPWFYGPNQPPRQTLFFRMVRDGGAPIVGGGGNLRSMAYVDNLCQGLILAAIAGDRADRQTYWIADERPYSMNEIVDTVERLLDAEFNMPCKHKRLRLPGLASELAWVIDYSLQSLGLYHQKIHVLSEMNKTIACSIETARRELGYHPQVSLEEGMRRSIAWCVERGMLP